MPHNIDKIKDIISEKNNETSEMINSLAESIETLHKNEETLQEKKSRRLHELEQTKKRYSKMKNFRPAFMDEYEKKEQELQQMYLTYVERYRNIEYLESELEKYRTAEAELVETNQRRLALMRKKIQEEELKIMRGGLQDPDQEEECKCNSRKAILTAYSRTKQFPEFSS